MSTLSEETHSSKRMSRYKRRMSDKALYFTPRDFTILHTLYKYHLLTTHQIVAVHQGSEQKTRWRLRELFDAGYLERFHTKTDMTVPGSEPVVYALTDRGADWLSTHRPDIERQHTRYNERNARRTLSTIPHSLMVAEIMLRFELSAYFRPTEVAFISQQGMLARAPEVTRNRRTPTQWNHKILVKGEPVVIGNNPDQMFGVIDRNRPEGRNTLYFFMEADRASETVRPVTTHLMKATIYKKMLGYYHTHLQKVHQGVFGDWMRNFRVLFVVDSTGKASDGKTRLENFIETAGQVTEGRIADLFLFTTFDQFKRSESPLNHLWVNAAGKETRLL
jgi:hypothetical protein